MKIAVCIKQVPDTETKIKVNSGQLDLNGVKWILNPYDEFAVEEALKIKGSNADITVTAITVGPKTRTIESLRTCLAMGADDAVVVDTSENLDSFSTAQVLAKALEKQGPFDLILAGKSAIDDNQFAVAQMTAEFLELPHVTNISKAEYSGQNCTLEREVEGGQKQIFETSTPCVLTTNKGLNTPRYASLPGIMKAKKKPVTELNLESLDVKPEIKYELSDFELPADRAPVQMLAGEAKEQVETLVKKLREEAKVL